MNFEDFIVQANNMVNRTEEFHKEVQSNNFRKFKLIGHDVTLEEINKCSDKEICYYWSLKWTGRMKVDYDELVQKYGEELEKLFPNVCRIYKLVRKCRKCND